jgi:hypothetical protein
LRLIQLSTEEGRPVVGWVTPDRKSVGHGGPYASTYELALAAIATGESLPPGLRNGPARPCFPAIDCCLRSRIPKPLANLEYHHFKYAAHRRPGDVHLHFFGTATLSFADGIRVEPGDVFEVDLPALGAPLVNRLAREKSGFALHGVRSL